LALEGLRLEGFAIVEGVIAQEVLERTREAMYAAQSSVRDEIGTERLERAGELGVVRLMLKYHPHFFDLLAVPEILAVVDAALAPTAILHLQNGLILPPLVGDAPDVFQLRFHRDFPRVLGGTIMSINTFLAIDDFTSHNGGTLFVPGSQQVEPDPTDHYMREVAVQAECPAGSMIVFDSTTLHAAGQNHSQNDRLAINQQFTRSYVKPQIDYVRALGDHVIEAQPPRTQQLLGWYTRVVTSLDEFYRPDDERLYRAGQG